MWGKMMRRKFILFPLLAAIALLSALVPGAATAQSGAPFYWESIDVLIDVQENGDMLVTETQTYVFTDWHHNQRYRYIPLDKVDGIDDISVSRPPLAPPPTPIPAKTTPAPTDAPAPILMDTDTAYGGRIPVNTGIEDGQQWIRWSHRELNLGEKRARSLRLCRNSYSNATCARKYPPKETFTFVLQYRVRGGLHLDEAGDMVYWKALFKKRDADIRSGSVTVRLPESLAGQISEYRSFTRYLRQC